MRRSGVAFRRLAVPQGSSNDREDDLEPLNRNALWMARDVADEGDALCNTWVYDPQNAGSSGEWCESRVLVGWAVEKVRADHLGDQRLPRNPGMADLLADLEADDTLQDRFELELLRSLGT